MMNLIHNAQEVAVGASVARSNRSDQVQVSRTNSAKLSKNFTNVGGKFYSGMEFNIEA